MTTRFALKMQQRLREEISKVLQHELHDPRLAFLTVTRVKIEPNMRTAKVYVSVFGEDNVKRRVLAGLKHASGFVRKKLSERIHVKHIPTIAFCLDDYLGGTEDQEPPPRETSEGTRSAGNEAASKMTGE